MLEHTNVSMPGKLVHWPEWPEFTQEKGEQEPDLLQYKQEIAFEYGTENLCKSWLRICKELESVTELLAEEGTSAIPELQYDEIFQLSTEQKQKLKDIGCVVVRNVVSQEQATEWFHMLKQYVADNRPKISGEEVLAVKGQR